MTTTVNFFGFEPGHLDVSAFDVTQCYEDGHQYTYMSVKIKGILSDWIVCCSLIFMPFIRNVLRQLSLSKS